METEDTETEDEEIEALAEDMDFIFLESDNDDDVLFCHPLASKLPVKKTKCNQANRPQVQHSNSPSSDDEFPDLQKKDTAKAKRRSPATPPVAGSHNVGASSGSSPALRLMQQQGRMRFSDIVSKCQRRDVIVKERREVLWAAKRFASKLGNEKFLVVMRDAQVYQGFHLVNEISISKSFSCFPVGCQSSRVLVKLGNGLIECMTFFERFVTSWNYIMCLESLVSLLQLSILPFFV